MTAQFLNVYTTNDNIIPNGSTLPIWQVIGSKDKEVHSFEDEYIGAIVGGTSQHQCATGNCYNDKGVLGLAHLFSLITHTTENCFHNDK